MSFSIKLGNFLYKNAFVIYKPMYSLFKKKQDAFEIELLKKHVNSGDIILDIGANIGFYAAILSSLTGNKGLVHCFEPDSKNFEHLKKSCHKLKNVLLINKAAGSKTETIKIYTSKNLNVDHRTYKPKEYDKEISIEAVSMDDYLGAQKKVDLIKMDIQGFEMQAIRGMEKILESNPDVKIISEFWPFGLKSAGSSVGEYYLFLKSKGFNCFLLKNNKLEELNEEKVTQLEPLGEKHYFNIFAKRNV
jgi:FkbM family methyltransferase